MNHHASRRLFSRWSSRHRASSATARQRRRAFHRPLLEPLEDRRLLAAADLDLTFGIDGRVTTDFGSFGDDAYSVATQPDGKILVAGEARNGTTVEFALARYNSDGSLDSTFGSGGKVTTAAGGWSSGSSVAVQTDGKILVAGDADTRCAVVRYNHDGSLDTGFGTAGRVVADMGCRSVTMQSDGRILVAGRSVSNGTSDFAVVRYNSDGSLDSTFNGNGKVTTDFAMSFDGAYSMALQSDGRILVAGYSASSSASDFAVVRYNGDGSLDSTFGIDGKVATDFAMSSDGAYSMALQSDGRILVAGYSNSNGTADFAVVRYNGDGSLDSTFDGDGKVTTDFAGSDEEAYSLALQSDGKIVVAGYSSEGGTGRFALARYNSDGSLDTSFDSDGKVTTGFGTFSAYGNSLTVQPDGRILVAGNVQGSSLDFALVRYEGDPVGSISATVSDGTLILTDTGSLANSLTVSVNGANLVITDATQQFQSAPIGGTLSDGGRTLTMGLSAITGNIAIHAGGGDDTILIDSIDATLNSSLIIHGGADDDQVIVNAALTFDPDRYLDIDLTADAAPGDSDLIQLGGSADLALSGSGSVTLKASRSVTAVNGAQVTTEDGDIVLEANQGQSTPGQFLGMDLHEASLRTTGQGNIRLTGYGGAHPSTQWAYGVYLVEGTVVAAEGSGSVTIIGTGGAGANGNRGVSIENGAAVSTAAGDIAVSGTGRGTGYSNLGVLVGSGGRLAAGGSGNLEIQGTGGDGTDYNHGVLVQNSGTRLSSATGEVSVSGTAHGAGIGNVGIMVSTGAEIHSFGGGQVTLQGTGGSGTADGYGVAIASGAIVSTSGSLGVTGTGGDGSGGSNFGVWVTGSGSAVSGSTIQITARGGSDATGLLLDHSGSASLVGSGALTLTADRMSIGSTATISAGTRNVTLQPLTAGRAIDLGSPTDIALNVLELSDAELDRITAAHLVIGRSTAGAIHVSQPISPASAQALVLTTGGTVTQAAPIVTSGLGVSAGGAITLEHAGNDAFAFSAKATSGSISYADSNDVAVGSVHTLPGVSAANGSVMLRSYAGNVRVFNTPAANDVASNFTVTIIAYGNDAMLNVFSGAVIVSTMSGGFNTFRSDKMQLDGSLVAAQGVIALLPHNSGKAIDLGSVTDVAPKTLELSDAELDRVTAASLRIGDSLAGPVTVSSSMTRPAATDVRLTTGGTNSIVFDTEGSLIAGGGDVTLITGTGTGSGGIEGNSGTTNVIANRLSITSGARGVGASGNYLTTSVNSLSATAVNSAIRLHETDQVTIVAPGLQGGLIHLESGTFQCGANDLIADASNVAVRSNAVLDLNGFSDWITGLIVYGGPSSAARVETGTGILTIGSNGISYGYSSTGAVGATISGNLDLSGAVRTIDVPNGLAAADLAIAATITNGGLRKTGAGTLALTGHSPYTASTTVDGGTLRVTGSIGGSSVTLSATTLAGTGTTGAVTVNGGTVSPGTSPGVLSSGDVTFSTDSICQVEVDGPSVGTQYDQLNVSGAVTLSGATLQVTGSYVPLVGDEFTLIANDGSDPVIGTFEGLAEGVLVIVNGIDMRITYVGGDGNDVVLVPFSVPPTIALSGDASVNEGSTYTLVLENIEPSTNTVTSYQINWGDGTFDTLSGSPNGLSKTHVYANGAAGGTSRTITVDLTDANGTFVAAGAKTIMVNNVVPTIALGGAASADVGAVYTLNLGTVVDPGADTVTSYTIYWGDGTSSSFSGSPSGLSRTHVYADAAPGGTSRTIMVSLTDEDGTFSGAGRRTITVFGLTLRAWGFNAEGQLGDGTTARRSTPVAVSGLTSVISVAQGWSHGLALRQDGTVWTWGSNSYGQLGDGTTSSRTTPAAVVGLNNVVAIAAGTYYSLALKSDGSVWAWGYNGQGQLGDGTTTQRTTPVLVSGLSGVTAVAAGVYHSLALRSDGTVWAWGHSQYGQLGDGTTTQRTTPVLVSGLTGATAVAAGVYHSLALRSDGTVWAWGYNDQGQLGDGTTTRRTTPVLVSGLTGVTAVAAGVYHSLALRSDGTVWAWGHSQYGQLGDGTTAQRTTPILVSGLSGVTAIAAGFYHSLALRSDGTVGAWGFNGEGQLGDGSTTNRNTPVVVSGLSGVASISAMGVSSSARLALVPGWIGTGKAVNGYLVGATAFFDANRNGVLDADEPSSFTDAAASFNVVVSEIFDTNGNGVLDDDEGQWVIQGGVDSSTGLPAVSKLTAPAGFSVVTPLTTLISTLSSQYELSVAEATARIQEVFELQDVELSSLDPIAASLSGDAAAPAVFAAHARVQDTIAQVVGVLGAVGDAPPANEIVDAILAEFAIQIAAPDAMLDLSQAATVEAILQDTAARAQVVVDDQVLTGAAAVIASTNQLIDAIPLSGDIAYLTQIAQVKTLSQGVIVEHLGQAAQGSLDVETLVENYTGAALEAQVPSSATPATLVVPHEVLVNTTSDAGAVVTFDVSASNLAGEPVPVNCTPASGNVFPPGTTLVTCSATADGAPTAYATFPVTVIPSNLPPVAANDNFATLEDQSVSGNVLDNDSDADAGDVLTVVAVNGTPDAVGQPLSTQHGTVTLLADGNFTYLPRAGIEASSDLFTYTISDGNGGEATAFVSVAIKYRPRVAIDPIVQSYVFAVGSPMTFRAAFSHAAMLDTTSTTWTFSHVVGLETYVETRPGTAFPEHGSGLVEDVFVFDNDPTNRDGAGVYTVSLTVRDSETGATTSETQTFVVYDPSEGFVTGGGWINSPVCAYYPNPSLSGRATFGFVSKYQKGAATPTGQTEFQFKLGNLNFHSSSYDWLVVAGARAQYKGTGTINGHGDYAFLLTAIDGQVNGGGGTDKFRIKIWDKDTGTVVYDNQIGASDDANPATTLGGGQIVIHKAGNGLTAVAGDSAAPGGVTLTPAMLDAGLAEAFGGWISTDLPAHRLAMLDRLAVQVAQLPGSTLGLASTSTNLIWLDVDGAGLGWSLPGGSGGYDLVSAISHELGHILGFDHDRMPATLPARQVDRASDRFRFGGPSIDHDHDHDHEPDYEPDYEPASLDDLRAVDSFFASFERMNAHELHPTTL